MKKKEKLTRTTWLAKIRKKEKKIKSCEAMAWNNLLNKK